MSCSSHNALAGCLYLSGAPRIWQDLGQPYRKESPPTPGLTLPTHLHVLHPVLSAASQLLLTRAALGGGGKGARERARARERGSEREPGSERGSEHQEQQVLVTQAASRGCAPADCCFLSGTSLPLPSAACLIPSCPEPGPGGGGVGSQLLHCAGSPAVPAFPCPAPTRPELCTLIQGLAPPPGTSTAACHLTQPPSLPQGSPGKAAAKDCSQASAAKAHSPSHACFPFSLFRP